MRVAGGASHLPRSSLGHPSWGWRKRAPHTSHGGRGGEALVGSGGAVGFRTVQASAWGSPATVATLPVLEPHPWTQAGSSWELLLLGSHVPSWALQRAEH